MLDKSLMRFSLNHMVSKWENEDFFRRLLLRMSCLYVLDHDVWNVLKNRNDRENLVEYVKGVEIGCDEWRYSGISLQGLLSNR